MIVGRLNKRITLIEPVSTPDGRGGSKTVWTPKIDVWSEFKKPSLATGEVTGAFASILLREIQIRYRTDIRKGWKVKYKAKTYTVEHTYDYPKETTILVCKEVVI